MSKSVLNEEELKKRFDEVIDELRKNKDGLAVMSLADTISHLARLTGNHIYYAIFYGIGVFGAEITEFYPLIAIPLLPDDIRGTYRQLFEEAVREGAKALETIREELCSMGNIDANKLMEAVGTLVRYDVLLTEKRTRIMRTTVPLVPKSPR